VSAAGGADRARLVLGLVLLVAIIVALRFLPLADWLQGLTDYFAALGPWGIGLFAIVYALAAIFFVPGSALTIGAGVIYGLGWGFVAVSAGSTLGAAGAFLVARYLPATGSSAGRPETRASRRSTRRSDGRDGRSSSSRV